MLISTSILLLFSIFTLPSIISVSVQSITMLNQAFNVHFVLKIIIDQPLSSSVCSIFHNQLNALSTSLNQINALVNVLIICIFNCLLIIAFITTATKIADLLSINISNLRLHFHFIYAYTTSNWSSLSRTIYGYFPFAFICLRDSIDGGSSDFTTKTIDLFFLFSAFRLDSKFLPEGSACLLAAIKSRACTSIDFFINSLHFST